MHDLVYSWKCRKILSEKFPQAKIEDACDDIHEERFWIEIDDNYERDYYKFLIENSFAEVSLKFLLKAKDKKYLEKLITEV